MNAVLSFLRPAILATIALGASQVGAQARIESFSPTGYTKDVRQVAVRFSDPMVELGDPDRSDPFAVRCAVSGHGRWIDERNWVYDFDHDVPGAERCRFTLRRNVRPLAGEHLTGPREHIFDTGGPAILDNLPSSRSYGGIDERQVFLLALDAAADDDSIRTHAHCRIDGESRVGLDVVSGVKRSEILDGLTAHRVYELDALVDSASSHLSKDDGATLRERALGRIVMVRCAETLPGDAEVDLVWGAGVAGANGNTGAVDQVLFFAVRRPFAANVVCGEELEGRCLRSIAIEFTAPVERRIAENVRLVDSAGAEVPAFVEQAPQVTRVGFGEGIAEDRHYRFELAGHIEDIDGRPLANEAAFPLDVRLGVSPLLATFGHRLTVTPPGVDASAPVLLYRPGEALHGRRLRVADEAAIARWLQRFDTRGSRSRWGGYESPLLAGAVGAEALELRFDENSDAFQMATVPVGAGLQFHELTLPPSKGVPGARYVSGHAVAASLAVHFQYGRESSLVWVTRFDDARPVVDATVRITDGCTGKTLSRGLTDEDGLVRLGTALPEVDGCDWPFYLVSARKGGDFAFVASRSPLPHWSDRRNRRNGSLRGHTVLDRSLFQPGETVSMKHILRLATSEGFALPDSTRTVRLSIHHRGYGEAHAEMIDIDPVGTAISTYRLPANAKLGRYDVVLEIGEARLESARFRVERFRVGSLRASIETPGHPIVAPASVPLDLEVRHLAGGGAANLAVAIRARVYEHYNDYWPSRKPMDPVERTVRATLDDRGQARVVIPDMPPLPDGGRLFVEMDYRDDNGQVRTASESFEVLSAAIRLEVEPGETDGRTTARIGAVDANGVPLAGIDVEAEFFSRSSSWLGERLPGGFRGGKSHWVRNVQGVCSAVTDASGAVTCPIPHEVRNGTHVQARARDGQGNIARATGYVGTRYADRMIKVDREGEFAPGETVAVRLSVPFTEATALVSVHREGVLDAFVTPVRAPQTVVEVPLRPNYAPNVLVSVTVVAPPETTTAGTFPGELEVTASSAELDFEARMPRLQRGFVPIRVNNAGNTLNVRVEPDRSDYRIRDVARVRVIVTDPAGLRREDADLALYAVDEGLLHLWPNDSAAVLDAMMARRPIDVSTRSSLDGISASLALHTVWSSATGTAMHMHRSVRVPDAETDRPIAQAFRRERLDPLLLWRGRIALDEDGAAEIDIPLNDLVTSFRIVAVATADAHLFGTGEASIRTTQDLVLSTGLPQTVREGDRFLATFAVRNATNTRQQVKVVANAAGLSELRPRTVVLPPGASKEVSWRVTVPVGADRLDWDVTARSPHASDALAATQTVIAPVPVRVQQATLARVDGTLELPVARPGRALPNRGGVAVSLRRSMAGALDAMREYMARYPYTCLEQDVSAAVARSDTDRWFELMTNLDGAMDVDGLLKFFPSDRLPGSPVLTAYVLTIADANDWTIPEDYRDRLIGGLAGYLRGDVRRHDDFPNAAPSLTRLTALAALARQGAAQPGMLSAFDLNLDTLPTSALLDWIDTLHRIAPENGELATAKKILRARLNLQGTSLGFSTEHRDRLWWLMVSPDGNAARAVVSLIDDPDWRPDMPRMMRGLLGRQQRGRWQTTVANAWGAVATTRFAEVFEAEPVSGTSVSRMGDDEHRTAWRDDERPARIEIPWSASQTLTLRHEGTGVPWSVVELRAAVPRRQVVARGFRIERAVETADGQARQRTWERGDVAEVVLTIDADRDMTWVVVEDPLPPGAVVLGSGLGGDAPLLADSYERGDRWPVFTERGSESYRAYYRYVPKGRFTLRYSARYNTAGTFHLPPTRVEAMYAPEMHAERPTRAVTIR